MDNVVHVNIRACKRAFAGAFRLSMSVIAMGSAAVYAADWTRAHTRFYY